MACSCGRDLLPGIKVRPKVMPGHSRNALEFDHSFGRNLPPLAHSLRGYPQRTGNGGRTARILQGSKEGGIDVR
jgi:hypothetical protein